MNKHGFTLLTEQYLHEVDGTARLWRHDATGAQLLSVVNGDENKCFGVSFRTPPADSTGVAHILEHSVLCGSDKYPVKEPFVELLKGSLSTFLNAFTYPDKTCYPIASCNLRDFYNLTDVYIDAVFHPRITEDIFRQEGWHVEAETSDGPCQTSPARPQQTESSRARRAQGPLLRNHWGTSRKNSRRPGQQNRGKNRQKRIQGRTRWPGGLPRHPL